MRIEKLSDKQRHLRKRILEISYDRKLSHLGSCLSAVDIIYAVYITKKYKECFVLSSGHAVISLNVVLEEFGLLDSLCMNDLNIHPDRNPKIGIDVSTGSLGQGLPIALGLALAKRNKNIYCLISDGECSEGSVWETLRVGIEQKLDNLKIIVNGNGWGAYDPISLSLLLDRINGFGYNPKIVDGHNVDELSRLLVLKSDRQPLVIFANTDVEQFRFLKGQDAHYYVMNSEDYESTKDILR